MFLLYEKVIVIERFCSGLLEHVINNIQQGRENSQSAVNKVCQQKANATTEKLNNELKEINNKY